MLGLMYYNGRGVEKDYEKAKEYFEVTTINGTDRQKNESNLTYNLIHFFVYLFH